MNDGLRHMASHIRRRAGGTLLERTGIIVAALALAGALGGCGEQDLYEEPESPYEPMAVLALPSEAQDVSVLGETAFIACGQAGLIVVDISNPSAPVILDMIDTHKYAESILMASVPTAGGVADIAFVVEGTEGITTYDCTDPRTPVSYEQGTTAVDGNGLFIDIPEDPLEPYVVYLAENWKGVRIFESDPAVPGLLRYNGAFSYTRGYAKAISVRDGYAYVADDEMGLAVMDVREPVLSQVRVVSACDTEGNCLGIDIEGDYAFLADGYNGLMVARINGAEAPVMIGHLLEIQGKCRDIVVRDGQAFIAAQDGGVHVIDVRTPSRPEVLGRVVTSYATGIAAAQSGVVVVSDRDDGLIVLKGPAPFSDRIAPSTVSDLTAAPADSETVVMRWRAPGNDQFQGTAAAYDVRYSVEAISEESWDTATEALGEPAPSRSGTEEEFELTGLLPGTHYFFALRTRDDVPHWSHLSNVVEATTPSGNVPPTLSGIAFSPAAGGPSMVFSFEVVYTDGDGDPPARADVVIDDIAFAMTEVTGDYEHGALFRYETTLDTGAHDLFFVFNDGHNDDVTTDTRPGPLVGEVFTMGSPPAEPGRDTDETQHLVVLTREAWIDDHEVTQDEYETLMGTNPSHFMGPERPVERVTWFDAVTYCNARSVAEGFTPAYVINGATVTWNRDADGYRLPTEAEWERACRAGSQTAFATGDLTEEYCGMDPVLDVLGWYCGNAGASTHDVMTRSANAWDLHDMHGNVWEWCWDVYVEDLGSEATLDPTGPPSGSQRVIRGGSWYYYARECRSASRAPYWPNSGDDIVGFRVARTVTGAP